MNLGPLHEMECQKRLNDWKKSCRSWNVCDEVCGGAYAVMIAILPRELRNFSIAILLDS